MKKYILAIDQGTTSTRAFLFNKKGKITGKAQKKITQIYPEPGWVEHNPEEIWQSTLKVINKTLKKTNTKAQNIISIGITNQRETTILWNKKTGKPIYNAIVWQDRRTKDICNTLKEKGLENKFKNKTGLLLDPYFSATKIPGEIKPLLKKSNSCDIVKSNNSKYGFATNVGGNPYLLFDREPKSNQPTSGLSKYIGFSPNRWAIPCMVVRLPNCQKPSSVPLSV